MLKFASILCVLFISSLLSGCAQVTSLNLQKHQFGQLPTKIIWIQVAGLQEEHIAMLKYSYQSTNEKTSFENFLCIGKTWEYNLFKIRPTPFSSFMSQMTGKNNIKNKCEDYNEKPIWSYLKNEGYRVGIFEGEMKKSHSLLKSKQCEAAALKKFSSDEKGDDKAKVKDGQTKKKDDFLGETTLWKMSKASAANKSFFHVSDKKPYQKSAVYYDKSCLTGECYSTMSDNVISIHDSFAKNKKNYMFLVRNFNYLEALNKKNIKKVKHELMEIDKTIRYFQKLSSINQNVLVLVTTAGSKNVEFPRSGQQWAKFEKKGKYLLNKKSQLISTTFATGARAENFCGMYEQNEILARIFSGPKQQGLELAIINPFE